MHAKETNRPNFTARIARWSATHRKRAIWGWLGLVVALVALIMGGQVIEQKQISTVDSFSRESQQAERALTDAGLAPVYATYWNTLLLPVMAMRRLLVASRENDSDVHPYPRPLDAILGSLLTCERALLRIGTRLPFGGSVLAVATKRDG